MSLGLLPDVPPGLPGVPVASDAAALAAGCDLVLGHREGALSLWHPGGPETPLFVDFAGGRTGYRVAADRVRHEKLVRAMGTLPENGVVIDATAGLGRDAAVLAAAGWQVLLLERQPVLHAMLSDGLRRAGALTQRMRLVNADSVDWLTSHPVAAQAVYLDPMFPEREKSAAVKKDLAWLQQLSPIEETAGEALLLEAALTAACKRVVVKRPLRAPLLPGRKPSHQLAGKTVRFDVYVTG
ncbi:class I SAM-dependent methyltransferase [Alcanivorax sp. S71-1-4]|uniref:class I SAM-dependent methyltransferase n=1 Tax=Alcanivorax sp. S71-1-4 TaxID=1177159 RepID=UPI00135A8519|nr:class I SAM-dependent methyltransferase [Alcanivorax sp. S71-1-4]